MPKKAIAFRLSEKAIQALAGLHDLNNRQSKTFFVEEALGLYYRIELAAKQGAIQHKPDAIQPTKQGEW